MLAGRARRNKMRAQRAAATDGPAAGGGAGGGGGGELTSASDVASAYRPRPQSNKADDRRVSFGDDVSSADEAPRRRSISSFSDEKDPKPSNKKNPKKIVTRRSSHLQDTSIKDKHLENDKALKDELVRLESTDSHWSHPMGFNLLGALRILNAPLDPVLNNTGYWIQPEDLEDIPAMFDSYLNVNCLYYSLVGVLAIETSLWLPIPGAEAPEYAKWLITVSRFCWAANGVWSMSAVVASFHILWSVYATPTWAKRRFVFDNSRTISVVYAMGAPNFAMMLVGTITGVMGNVVVQDGFERKDWVSAVMGLGLGAAVTLIFVLCSGSLISKVVRPWKVADEKLADKRKSWTETGRSVSMFFKNIDSAMGVDSSSDDDNFFDNQQSTKDPTDQLTNIGPEKVPSTKNGTDSEFSNFDAELAGFGELQMPSVTPKLIRAGFTMGMLQRVNNELLLDQLLQGAGVDKPGERLRVILFIRDAPPSTDADDSDRQAERARVSLGSGKF